MKKTIRIEKINIIDNNLVFSAIKIRITILKKLVFSYSYKPKNRFKPQLKHI